MTEIIEKLEHGIMICSMTGTMLVHIDKWDAEKVVTLLKEHETIMQRIKGKCRICPHCANCNVDENGLLKEADRKKDGCQMKRPKKTFWDSLSEADLMEPMHHFKD